MIDGNKLDALQLTEQKLITYLAALREEAVGYDQRGHTDRLTAVQAEIRRVEDILGVAPEDPRPAGRRRRGTATGAAADPATVPPVA